MPLFDFHDLNTDDTVSIGIIILEVIFLIVVLIKVLKMWYTDSSLKIYAEPMIYLNLAFILFPLIMVITFLDQYATFNLVSFIFINLILYLFFWYLAMTRYIKNVFRVPDQRTIYYTYFPKIFLINALISLVNGFIRFISEVNSLLTIIISLINFLIIILSMFYLYSLLNNELKTNLSQLSKARIRLFQYIVSFQIMQFFLFIIGLVVYVFSEGGSLLMNTIGVLIVLPTGVLSGIFLLWSVNIPGFLRRRYNIDAERFEKFKDV